MVLAIRCHTRFTSLWTWAAFRVGAIVAIVIAASLLIAMVVLVG